MSEVADLAREQVQQMIGRRLKQLRRTAGFTALDTSHRTFIHHTRIARIEQGKTLPRPDELEILLQEYGALELDAVQLRQKLDECLEAPFVFRHSFDSRLQSAFDYQKSYWAQFVDPYNQFYFFETLLVQGLFQIRPYMQHVLTGVMELVAEETESEDWKQDQIEKIVDLRLGWQQKILYDPHREFTFILAESVLLNQLCEKPIMAAQCRHLIEMSSLPNVEIRILPTNSGVLRSSGFRIGDKEFVETETDLHVEFLRSERQINLHLKYFNELSVASLGDNDSRAAIAKYADMYAADGDSGDRPARQANIRFNIPLKQDSRVASGMQTIRS